jgi:hypothetical protein
MNDETKMPAPVEGRPVESRIVYIREVDPRELPEEARARLSAEHLYAIHDTRGNRLAVVADRATAFHIARQHEMTPVSAH